MFLDFFLTLLILAVSKTQYLPNKHQNQFVFALQALLKDKSNRKIDLLLGVNRDEATYFLIYGHPGFDRGPSLISRKVFLNTLGTLFSTTELMKQAVIYEYTDWADESNQDKNRDALIALLTDSLFTCPMQEFAKR